MARAEPKRKDNIDAIDPAHELQRAEEAARALADVIRLVREEGRTFEMATALAIARTNLEWLLGNFCYLVNNLPAQPEKAARRSK